MPLRLQTKERKKDKIHAIFIRTYINYEDIYVSLSTKKNDHINTHNLKHGRRQENYFLDGRRE